MGTQFNILLLTEILGIPVILIIIVVIVIMAQSKQDKNQKMAQEKVIELTGKGHDAKLCPKCKGKGGHTWGEWANCPECAGLGYIYKLRPSEESPSDVDNKVGLHKCANCGAMVGKLEKSYVFEGQTVCGRCYQRLKNQE